MRDAHRMYAAAIAGTRWWVRLMLYAAEHRAGYVRMDDRRAYERSLAWAASRGLLTPDGDRLAEPLMHAIAMNAPHWWHHHEALRMYPGPRMLIACMAIAGEWEPARRIVGGTRYAASIASLRRVGYINPDGSLTAAGRSVVWVASTNRYYLGRLLAGFEGAIAAITAGTTTDAMSAGPAPTPSGRRPRS